MLASCFTCQEIETQKKNSLGGKYNFLGGYSYLFASFKIQQNQNWPSSSPSSSKFAFPPWLHQYPFIFHGAGGSSRLAAFCCLVLCTDINHSLDRTFLLPQFFSGLRIFLFFILMASQSLSEFIHSTIKWTLEKLLFSNLLVRRYLCPRSSFLKKQFSTVWTWISIPGYLKSITSHDNH